MQTSTQNYDSSFARGYSAAAGILSQVGLMDTWGPGLGSMLSFESERCVRETHSPARRGHFARLVAEAFGISLIPTA